MTTPEFSVLLLAWDDADPSVAVLGGAALPPTLPLVYQLAAQQPVLAVFPHLPAGEKQPENGTPAKAPAEPAASAPEAAKNALDTAVALPGVHLLPGPTAAETEVPAAGQSQSRIIGLADLPPASNLLPTVELAASETSAAEATAAAATARARSQWPADAGAPMPAGRWQAPAAPYLGAGSGDFFSPPPPAPPRAALAAPAMPADQVSTAFVRPRHQPQAGDLNFDPDPELPAVRQPAAFDEPTEEVGAAEAADLAAPEHDLTPEAPAPAAPRVLPTAPAPVPAALPAAAAGPVVLTPKPDGLNFRMIQYARQAARLVHGRADFAVIYAPNWPAWLAALEIRNRSGQPLVLYAASLAADVANPAERGWQLEVERMALRRAHLILVPDEAMRRRLHARYEDTIGEVRVVAAADEAAVRRVLSEVAVG